MFRNSCNLTSFIATGLLVMANWTPVATAQTSDAGTINASVTVQDASVTVTPNQDLQFGTHFATEGSVQSEQYGNWFVQLDNTTTTLDYTITQLPASLVLTTNPDVFVPITYGANSLIAQCDDGSGNQTLPMADPAVGISNCLPNGGGTAGPGVGNVSIGLNLFAESDPTTLVTVDLTGAAAGTYTGTIELTATIN
ncbi:MAG: hypothetical protein ACREMK_04555 [Gemmatimonadota bacterium]